MMKRMGITKEYLLKFFLKGDKNEPKRFNPKERKL
jgi:hypothetical protein